MRLADSDWSQPGSNGGQDQTYEIVLTGQLICKTVEESELVARLLPTHIELTRAEPGCTSFEVTRTDDPLVWQVDERFVSQQAFEAHQHRVAASEWGTETTKIAREYIITGSD
ncbi:MAG: antibiotic biosynthesis monooxygenase [Actinobacteria bacterium]|nr:antibiotic biosynthesis monooxygenase [Actinomycetota bacterium]